MERLEYKDKIIKLIKDTFCNTKLHLFEIKDNDGHSVLRTAITCKNYITVNDFIYNNEHRDADDNLDPAIEKYELSIPLSLYKSCALKDKAFILQFNVMQKMNELDSLLFAQHKPIRWFIKSITLDCIKYKIKMMEGGDC